MLIFLLVLILIFGGYGFSPYNSYGNLGWSPVAALLVALLIYVLFFGGFRLR